MVNFMTHLKKLSLVSATVLLVSFSTSHAAFAADPVTLNITGNVVASPCQVSADSKNMTIDLGNGSDLQTADLNAAGSGSDWIKFNVALQNCPAGTDSVTATFHGTADTSDVESLYSNTGTAENVAVQLEGQAASEPFGNGKTSTLQIASNAATWNLQTRAFSKNGNVSPGTINSVVTMSFAYN